MPQHHILKILCLIVTLRIITLWTPALIDTTEGRYASISQEMVTSGNWLTPQIHLPSGLEPYQGKPPLHFWITAAMLKAFGNSEFVARLPSLLGMLTCLAAVWVFAAAFLSVEIAALACVFFASSALSLLLSGSVHLDFTLSACVAWMIVGFCVHAFAPVTPREALIFDQSFPRKIFGLIPFIAAALGLLTKGPIAIVLAGIVVVPFLLLFRQTKKLLKIPWAVGLSLFFLISAPWFYLQEQASPGFIRYFFINENLLRYVTKSYGDRYGEGHVAPYGSAILMLLYGTLPWSLSLLMCCRKRFVPRQQWPIFVAWWGIAAALFFSLSRQLLEAYMLPAYAGMAIFCAWLVVQAASEFGLDSKFTFAVRSLSKIFFSLALVVVFGLAATTLARHFGSAYQFAPWMTPPIDALTCGVAIILVGMVAHSRWPNSSVTTIAAKACLAFTTLFCSLLVVAGQFASDKKSTGPILSAVRSEPHDKHPLVVGIAFGKPFSAYFYDDAVSSDPIKIVRVEPTTTTIDLPDNLIVLRKDKNSLSPELAAAYTTKQEFPFWIWLIRRPIL